MSAGAEERFEPEAGPGSRPRSGPPPVRVAVIGAGEASADELRVAELLGRALATGGAVVLSGGLGGVMEAAARGAVVAGGLTVGILPGTAAADANRWIRVPIATGIREARNALVVRAAESVVAVGGAWGTLSEIALARKMGIDVALLGDPPAEGLDLPRFDVPTEAAEWALERARMRRRS